MIYKGDVFAISHAGVMAAIDLRTGDVRWQLPVVGHHHALAGRRRGLCHRPDRPGDLRLARERPALLDHRPQRAGPAKKKGGKPPKRSRAVWSSPILATNRLITVSDQGEAVALNPKTGAVEQRLKLGDDALIGPIAAGGMIYVVDPERPS